MKQLMARLFCAAFIIFSVSPAFASKDLSDTTYLRKLSFHLRGQQPTGEEYKALKAAAANGQTAEFLQSKVAEYLRTPEYVRKMSFRLDELFRVKTFYSPSDPSSPPSPFGGTDNNALNALFRDLANQNLPWDTLLTGKSYHLYPPVYQSGTDELGFFKAVYPGLPEVPPPTGGPRWPAPAPAPTPINIAFSADDTRIAGAITTMRFFGRYTTTALNRNRRRAAAVFNIFLCDPMAAAVPPPPTNPDGTLDKAFPDTSMITEAEIRELAKRSDRHGSDKDCAQCHYKLDPMGMTFVASTFTLSPLPSPGRLIYKDKKTGELIDRPGRGIGDVAKSITEQSAYVDCQVGYFWDWFIGADRPLTSVRRAQLTAEFERLHRRTNDFVAYVVQQPEFRSLDLRTPNQARADQVKTVLKHCTDCHDAARIPSFVQWPIGGTKQLMTYWVDRISSRLDLKGDGAHKTMPPPWSSWQPTTEELQLIKVWVGDSAPDENGDPQI